MTVTLKAARCYTKMRKRWKFSSPSLKKKNADFSNLFLFLFQDIGLFLCCGFLFLWSISEVWRACIPGYRCGAPYYSVVYDNLLAEEVGNHLNEQLQKIAKEKAEKLCGTYIKSIRYHQHLPDGENVLDISEVWGKVSASAFYTTEVEREETGDNNREQERPA